MSFLFEPREQQERWLLTQWADRLGQVIESMTGESTQVNWTSIDKPAAFTRDEDTLFWEQPISLGADCGFSLAVPEAVWLPVGEQVLKAAGIEETDRDSARSTFLEILNQALSAVATDLGGQLSREVTCHDGKETTASPAGLADHSFAIHLSTGVLPDFQFSLRPEFFAVLRALAEQLSADQEESSEPSAPSHAMAAAAGADGSKTLDLLLDVELPVSVSFGRAQMLLKELIKLTSGSIVELNRTISEPVEIIVNNCVIARGEVVVVEGNYGVRIQQIVSRQERLRTLS
ncbi:MAG: flagellar motor switch protein FliN [Bryobacter sp.]|nr:flagellar motor switch protein FliN [Bryobacter sp.]